MKRLAALFLCVFALTLSAQTPLTADGLAAFTPAAVTGAFSPPNISGLKLWLKADTLSLSDNDPVGTWPDSSGLGNDATQATSVAKPLFKAGLVNGKGVVKFDAVDDGLATSLAITKPYTIFVVEKDSGASGSGRRTIMAAQPDNRIISVTSRSSGLNAYNDGGVSSYQETDTAHAHIGRLAIQSSASSYFVDSVDKTTDGTLYNDWGTVVLGYQATWQAEPAGCYVCEVIIYQGVTLSGADFSNVETYLKAKWATP